MLDRPRPELQPEPLRIAGMAVAASLDTTLGSTSNVLGAQNGPRADGFAEWAPRLVATLDASPARAARIALDYDGKRYFSTPAKRQDGYAIDFSGDSALGRDGRLSVSAFQRRSYEDQLAGSYPANGGGAVAIDQSHAQVRLAQATGRLTLTGAVTFDRLRYHDTVTTTGALLPQSRRDAGVLRASARVDYALPAGPALFAQLSRRDTGYGETSAYADRSSHEWRAIGGISADVTGLIRVSAGIGGYRRRYRTVPAGSPLADFGRLGGLAWDLRGAWYLSSLTTLSLRSSRDYLDSDLAASPGYEATALRGRIDHEFLRNLLASVVLGRETDRFRLIARRDRVHDSAILVDCWLSPRVLVMPRIEWLGRATDGGAHIAEFRAQFALSLRE